MKQDLRLKLPGTWRSAQLTKWKYFGNGRCFGYSSTDAPLTPRNTANAEHVVHGPANNSAKRNSVSLLWDILTHSSTKLNQPCHQQDALNGLPQTWPGWHLLSFLVILVVPVPAPALAPRLEVSCLEPVRFVCFLGFGWQIGIVGSGSRTWHPGSPLTPILLDFSFCRPVWC